MNRSVLIIIGLLHGCASTPEASPPDEPAPVSAGWDLQNPKQAAPDKSQGISMNLVRLNELLTTQDPDVRRTDAVWTLALDGVELAVIADPGADRMRIIAPVARVEELEPRQLLIMLEANFHTALDARYATSGGVVYAAFIHPLASLTDSELESALSQVASLARTFGSSYSSGTLQYGE